jgi:SnoaL-like domain
MSRPTWINMAGIASFDLGEEAAPLLVKITWVIVREDGDWKIASHHVSSKTPLIEPGRGIDYSEKGD